MPPSPVVFLLAHRRKGPYYFDVAPTIQWIGGVIRNIVVERKQQGERDVRDPPLLVWYRTWPDEAQARQHLAQIRRWPLLWQRQMVQLANPDWIDLVAVEEGFPFWCGLREDEAS